MIKINMYLLIIIMTSIIIIIIINKTLLHIIHNRKTFVDLANSGRANTH